MFTLPRGDERNVAQHKRGVCLTAMSHNVTGKAEMGKQRDLIAMFCCVFQSTVNASHARVQARDKGVLCKGKILKGNDKTGVIDRSAVFPSAVSQRSRRSKGPFAASRAGEGSRRGSSGSGGRCCHQRPTQFISTCTSQVSWRAKQTFVQSSSLSFSFSFSAISRFTLL